MTNKVAQFLNEGMTRDLSISKSPNTLAFENFNIRITDLDKNSLLSVTNEKGVVNVLDLVGTCLGWCVINDFIVLFNHSDDTSNPDIIYRLLYNKNYTSAKDSFTSLMLFKGNLNFDYDHTIETLGIYENESIQKVFWVDNLNQPRFINIVATNSNGELKQFHLDTATNDYSSDSFNFLLTVKSTSSIKAEQDSSIYGYFPSGIIQYAFTYSNKFGQESSVISVSDLLSSSDLTKGIKEDSYSTYGYRCEIDNVDTSFDYINLYELCRTSLDTTPTARLVASIETSSASNNKIVIYDNGTTGESIATTDLLYKGGDNIVAKTIAQKDGTLFLGNITLKNNGKELDAIKSTIVSNTTISEGLRGYDNITSSGVNSDFVYPFINDVSQASYFRKGNYYRLGVQFCDNYGKWSNPVFIKDVQATQRPVFTLSSRSYNFPEFKVTLSNTNSVVTNIKNLGYVKCRPVIVYPDEFSRVVIAQGIVNGTVFNGKDRDSNVSFCESDWFFRPLNRAFNYKTYYDLPSSRWWEGEIQSQCPDFTKPVENTANKTYYDNAVGQSSATWACTSYADSSSTMHYTWPSYPEQTDFKFPKNDSDYYAIDTSVVTLNSPDIESRTDAFIKNAKFSIVGVTNINKKVTNIICDLTKIGFDSSSVFKKKNEVITYDADNAFSYRKSFPLYTDITNPDWSDGEYYDTYKYNFVTYPWHRSGSLNNDIAGVNRTAVVKHKVFAEYLYGTKITWLDSAITPEHGISQVTITSPDTSDLSTIKTSTPSLLEKYNGSVVYRNNLNTIVSPYKVYKSDTKTINVAPIYTNYNNAFIGAEFIQINRAKDSPTGNYTMSETSRAIPESSTDNPSFFNEGVSIKYKSSKHAVFMLNGSNDNPEFLPSLVGDIAPYVAEINAANKPFFWLKNGTLINDEYVPTITEAALDGLSVIDGHLDVLLIGELTRDFGTENERKKVMFGGDTDYALKNNIWCPAGDDVILNNSDVVLEVTKGDTYYQRYDCLKTYPYTNDDENSVVEIGSVMIESYVNLNGRYDNNMGITDYSGIQKTTFNRINDVYSQKDNFFNYRILDSSSLKNKVFNNAFTWSQTKVYGADIDIWSTPNLASIYNVEGDKGAIEGIRKYGNDLIGFQDNGVFQILFNSRSQITTTDGTPIEIANTGKVDSVRYISTQVGCANSNSICPAQSGLFFIDDYNHAIMRYNSEGLANISQNNGFDKWMNDKFISGDKEGRKERTFYDRNYNDVYFNFPSISLLFSEKLNKFMSFMNYGGASMMDNIGNRFVSIYNTTPSLGSLYINHEGDYNFFYTGYKPYYMEYRINPQFYMDKVFNNVEFMADMTDMSKYNTTSPWDSTLNESFTKLDVFNEYQRGTSDLTKLNALTPINLVRKYRTWRANIPRDENNKLDRIRGPWINLRLTRDTSVTDAKKLMEFHNLIVKYSE